MFIFLKFLTYVIFTFIILNYYLNKQFKIEKIIELTLIIGIGLSIIDYLVKNNFKGKFNFKELFYGGMNENQDPPPQGSQGPPPQGSQGPPPHGFQGPPPQGFDNGLSNSMSSF